MNEMNEYEQLVAKYISYKRAEGLRESTLGDLSGRLKMMGRECRFTSVFDIEAKAIAGWFAQIAEPETEGGKYKRSAKTRLLLWKYGHRPGSGTESPEGLGVQHGPLSSIILCGGAFSFEH